MTDLRTAAQQALESIDWLRHHLMQHHGCLHMDPTASGIPAWLNKNEAALRAALAEEALQRLTDVQQEMERNFCPRCGKRTNDIHTCTPPDSKHATIKQHKPLTDAEIADLWHQTAGFHHHFARAIEKAHGIGV